MKDKSRRSAPKTKKSAAKSAHQPRTLAACRRRIDEIDGRLIDLLDQRARVARRIGEIKQRSGRSKFDAGRHIEKLRKIATRGSGDFPIDGLRLVFGEILSASLALQAPQTIGYLGPKATFSHIAATRAFGSSVTYEPYSSIPEIFQAVEKRRIDFGIVPVENSTGGVIHTTLDMLMHSSLSICAEIHIPVHHHVMCKGELEKIKKVCTHPQILSQCREWLQANLPRARRQETASSGVGAEMAVKDPTVAAIGPELAAKDYGLPILVRHVEDRHDNVTRFIIIGRQSPMPSGNDKTSIMFSVKDEPGALRRLLDPFSNRGLNLTKIESRPSRRRAWDYLFFVDIHGHMNNRPIAEALEELKPFTTYLRVLGSYPIDPYGDTQD